MIPTNFEARDIHRMQLVAISQASLQNTETTRRERIGRESAYWTQAYADVCAAVDREMRERERARLSEERRQELEERLRERSERGDTHLDYQYAFEQADKARMRAEDELERERKLSKVLQEENEKMRRDQADMVSTLTGLHQDWTGVTCPIDWRKVAQDYQQLQRDLNFCKESMRRFDEGPISAKAERLDKTLLKIQNLAIAARAL
jgi:hypothetical protein